MVHKWRTHWKLLAQSQMQNVHKGCNTIELRHPLRAETSTFLQIKNCSVNYEKVLWTFLNWRSPKALETSRRPCNRPFEVMLPPAWNGKGMSSKDHGGYGKQIHTHNTSVYILIGKNPSPSLLNLLVLFSNNP